jgi:hypothetical protein
MWYNVTDLTAYFTLMAGVLPFWTMRFATRGKEGAIKTGILANLTIAGIAALFYLLLIPFITAGLGIGPAYLGAYFVVAILIIETYSVNMIEASLQAKMPQAIGYGLIVQQIGRVILGYILIINFHLLLLGAVVANLAAYAPQILYYLKLLAEELKQRFRREYVTEWLKGSLANIYNVVGSQLASLVFIMLFIYGGENGRGELGAGATIVNVITYSSFLAYALYPKLLAERKSELNVCHSINNRCNSTVRFLHKNSDRQIHGCRTNSDRPGNGLFRCRNFELLHYRAIWRRKC